MASIDEYQTHIGLALENHIRDTYGNAVDSAWDTIEFEDEGTTYEVVFEVREA